MLTTMEPQLAYADQMERDKTGQLQCHERVGKSLSGMPSAQTRLLHLIYMCVCVCVCVQLAKRQAGVVDRTASQTGDQIC